MSKTELTSRGISPFVARCFRETIVARNLDILDAPAGFGRHATWLGAQGHNVVGADIDAARIASFIGPEQGRGPSIRGEPQDLNLYREDWQCCFDVVIVVDFWSRDFAKLVHRYVKPGGYLVMETMGNRGGNWRQLPAPSEAMAILRSTFEIVRFVHSPAGPTLREAETFKCLAKRIEHSE